MKKFAAIFEQIIYIFDRSIVTQTGLSLENKTAQYKIQVGIIISIYIIYIIGLNVIKMIIIEILGSAAMKTFNVYISIGEGNQLHNLLNSKFNVISYTKYLLIGSRSVVGRV